MTTREKQCVAELCVYGFIRMYCMIEIPMDLQQLCLWMYLDALDTWNITTYNEGLEFDSVSKIVKVGQRAKGNWLNAFGSDIVNKGISQIWTLKITHHSGVNNCGIYIGIIELNKISSELMSNCFATTYWGYAYYTYSAQKYGRYMEQYAVSSGNGDIITMKLDMIETEMKKYGTLSFKINNIDYGVAFDDIDIEREYVMAVSFIDVNDELQIIGGDIDVMKNRKSPKKKDKRRKKKVFTDSLELLYECQASADMMMKIFTMKEKRFLMAIFHGTIKMVNDEWVIGENGSFLFKIIKEEINEDGEYILNMLWHKKEWEDDEWSMVNLVFIDEMDKKCKLKFKQTGIPQSDKYGNYGELDSIKIFWTQTIFKTLTQFGNIVCNQQ